MCITPQNYDYRTKFRLNLHCILMAVILHDKSIGETLIFTFYLTVSIIGFFLILNSKSGYTVVDEVLSSGSLMLDCTLGTQVFLLPQRGQGKL